MAARNLTKEEQGNVLIKAVGPRGANLKELQAAIDPISTVASVAGSIKLMIDFAKWVKKKGWRELPALWEKKEAEAYYYYLDPGLRKYIEDELEGLIKNAETPEEAVGYQYGLVFGEVEEGTKQLKVDAFFAFQDLADVYGIEKDAKQCIDALHKIENIAAKRKYRKPEIRTFTNSLESLFSKLSLVTAGNLLSAIQTKKTTTDDVKTWLRSFSKGDMKKRKTFHVHLRGRLLGIYARSPMIQKRDTPLSWLNGYYAAESNKETTGAFIVKPEKKIYLRTQYWGFMKHVLRKLQDYVKKAPPIVLCFAGYEKTETHEQLKESMESPKMDDTSSTCLAYVDNTIYRILCKHTAEEKVSRDINLT